MTGAFDSQLDSRRDGGAFVVAPRGDLDLVSAPAVQAALEAREPTDATVVLDLREVQFLDTSGLRLILSVAERARSGGFDFCVVRGAPRVQRIFEIAGLGDDEIRFVDDPAHAAGGGESAA